MKVAVLVISALLVAGCGSMPSMEVLEQQAFLTGDWSAVEKRERMIERRKMRNGNICPAGHVAVCESFGGTDRCSCVERDSVYSVIFGR